MKMASFVLACRLSPFSVAHGRVGRPALAAMLVLLALGAGTLSFGHEHPASGGLDEHSCVVCHVQHSTILPISVASVEPMATSEGETLAGESQLAESLACRLVPPLRGPPVA